MTPTVKARILKQIESLIAEGGGVASTRFEVSNLSNVDMGAISKWRTGCQILMRSLGQQSEIWSGVFSVPERSNANSYVQALAMQGALKGIEAAIHGDLLTRVESLIIAEECGNLLDQAEHLLSCGYFLAAGVLCRAVLEEHLRNWCSRENTVPTKPRPTLNDYISELYRKGHLNKLQMKEAEAMAVVGNDAAHNAPTLMEDDIQRLFRNVGEFLVRCPLP